MSQGVFRENLFAGIAAMEKEIKKIRSDLMHYIHEGDGYVHEDDGKILIQSGNASSSGDVTPANGSAGSAGAWSTVTGCTFNLQDLESTDVIEVIATGTIQLNAASAVIDRHGQIRLFNVTSGVAVNAVIEAKMHMTASVGSTSQKFPGTQTWYITGLTGDVDFRLECREARSNNGTTIIEATDTKVQYKVFR